MQSSRHISQNGDMPLIRWAIRGRTTHTLLSSGTNPSANAPPIATANFSGDVPLLFTNRRTARDVWVKWLSYHGFIQRRVSLPGRPVSYDTLKPLPGADLVTVALQSQALVPFFLNKDEDDA